MDGNGLRVAIAVARFNDVITRQLLTGAVETLARHGVKDDDIYVAWVPGSFELTVVAKTLAETGRYDAISLPTGTVDTSRYNSTANLLLAAGMKAFAEMNVAEITEAAKHLRALVEKRAAAGEAYQADSVRIMQHEVEALAAQLAGAMVATC